MVQMLKDYVLLYGMVFAMKRKLLVAMMVAILTLCLAVPAGAASRWDRSDLTWENILKYLDDTLAYGVVAEEYTQHGHSEANIYVDRLIKDGDNPILASYNTAPIIAKITLPEGHGAEKMTFALFYDAWNQSSMVSGTKKEVDVKGKTEVFVTFPPVGSTFSGYDLHVYQVENNQAVKNGTKNTAGLRVNYGSTAKTTGKSSSYIGSLKESSWPTLKLFQTAGYHTGGLYDNLTLGNGFGLYIKGRDKNGTEKYFLISSLTKSGLYGNTYLEGSVSYTLDGISEKPYGFLDFFYADVYVHYSKDGTAWESYHKSESVSYLSLQQNSAYYVKEGSNRHPLTIQSANDTSLAKKRLDKLAELSKLLANNSNSDIGLGGKAKKVGVVPDGTGNSTQTGPVDSQGRVVSLYHATVYAGDDGRSYVDKSSFLVDPGDAGKLAESGGLPLASNEYAVFNVVVGSDVQNVVLDNCILMCLLGEDGTLNKADVNWWREGNAQNYNRVIWNIVRDNGDGTYTPFEGTVYTGSGHGGLVLAPNATIINGTGDAVTLAARSVTSSGEIHHNSAVPGTTAVTYSMDAGTYLPVTKKWEDANNQDGLRPTSITVTLWENRVKTNKTVVLNEANNWTASFTGLDPSKQYTVSEEGIPKGYTSEVTSNASKGFTITNTHTPEIISISGIKTWDDNDNQDGLRPSVIDVTLTGTVGEAVVYHSTQAAKADTNWAYSWTNLYKYNAGKQIVYTVSEASVPDGYTVSYDGYNITNTQKTGTVDISGTKTWNDSNNQDGKRPVSITVNLLANGVTLASKTVSAADNWAYSWTNLPKYENGKAITYTITENAVSDYSTSYNGYDITNSYTPSKTSIMVMKRWVDGDDQDDARPASITVKLLANGADTGKTLTLSAENSWTGTFTQLDEKSSGQKIVYSIEEIGVAGYTNTVTNEAGDVFIITNTKDQEKPTATPEGTATVTPEATATVTPQPTATATVETQLGELTLEKADRLNTSKKLEGAEYTLFTEEACENVLMLNGMRAVFRTGANGRATLTGIPAGTYWVKETKAPTGYEVDPLPYRVDVVLNPETPQLVQVSDYPLRGALCLSKTVTGTATDEAFRFDIVLTGEPVVGTYSAQLNDQTTDPVSFTATENGAAMATVALKDGDTLTITGIRAGTKFAVTEQPNSSYDVTVNDAAATTAMGTISDTSVSLAKFKNTLKLTAFRVQKVWSGLAAGEAAPAIQLTLYCNGEEVKATPTGPDKDGWYTYSGLPAYVNGKAAVYTVQEAPVAGFTTTYINKGDHANANDGAYNGGIIKNSKIPQTGDSSTPMLWVALMLLTGSALLGITTLQKRRS